MKDLNLVESLEVCNLKKYYGKDESLVRAVDGIYIYINNTYIERKIRYERFKFSRKLRSL